MGCLDRIIIAFIFEVQIEVQLVSVYVVFYTSGKPVCQTKPLGLA